MADRYICVHGHFYQPPRENPWLEEIEVQDSAYPFHDWNERIHLECYEPNAVSRLLTSEGFIDEIVNNYAKISFNFGPTLLAWMARRHPAAYRRILETDRESAAQRSGHGNALAQVYNHLIMPLANRRDKVTQVVWGLRDFQKRFNRPAEGMWLAETAVDSETLSVLAELGVKFTVLAPHQARAIRPLGKPDAPWQDVSGGRVDPTCAYRWVSPQGQAVDIFFYDGPISQAIAFEGLLNNGEYLAGRLLGGFSDQRRRPQLVHVATDGETYGHHHRFGDMALAYALRKIERDGSVVLTNYGEFLARFPPEWQVEIVENTSWSCSHGVERWRSDCGCRIGHHGHWRQAWRGPLRDSLNWLRDTLDRLFEAKAVSHFKEPWAARNAYIDVMVDRNADALERFFSQQAARPLAPAERTEALKLLEMQRHGQLMFTSCGWFFDDISGVEGQTVLLFAARALQLAEGFLGHTSLEETFLGRLAKAPSNVPEVGHGAAVYERFVRPHRADMHRVAAHHAMGTIFQRDPAAGETYCYSFEYLDRKKETSGAYTLSVGRIRVSSRITQEALETAFGVLHAGGHDFQCVLRSYAEDNAYKEAKAALLHLFSHRPLTETLRALNQYFDPRIFSMQEVFLETRRRLIRRVIKEILGRLDSTYRQLVKENRKLMNYLRESDYPIPEAFRLALQYVLDRDVEDALPLLEKGVSVNQRLAVVVQEARKFGLSLTLTGLRDMVRRRIEESLEAMREGPDADKVLWVLELFDLADRLELEPFLWHAENRFHELWNGPWKNALDWSRPAPETEPYRRLAHRFRQAPPKAAVQAV
jgi:alpha-amylase/alpha-mannosidase (GH57 family)